MSDINEESLYGLRYQRLICRLARLKGMPIFYYALGLGPLRTTEGQEIAKEILNSATLVLVRDTSSFELCRDIGVNAPVIRSFDPAINIPSLLNVEYSLRTKAPTQYFRLGISLSKSQGVADIPNEQDEKVARFVEAIKKVTLRSEVEIISIQMCANPHNNDLELCQKINNALKGICPTSTISYRSNPGEMMGDFSSLDGIIAERLHAGIFAYSLGIPFAMIAHHAKCIAFAKDVGLPDWCLLDPMLVTDEIAKFIDILLRDPNRCKPSLRLNDAKQIALLADKIIIEKIRDIVGE